METYSGHFRALGQNALSQRQALKISEYILGEHGGLLDEEIEEGIIIGYNLEEKR